MAGKSRAYVHKPVVPVELVPRYEKVVLVLSGQMEIAQAARELDMTRHGGQHLVHRCEEALIDVLSRQGGPRPMSEERKRERKQIRDQKKTIEKLEQQIHDLENQNLALTMAMRARAPRTTTRRGGPRGLEDDDVARDIVAVASHMMNDGLAVRVVALVLVVALSTLYRYLQRARDGVPLVARRGPAPLVAMSDVLEADVVEILDAERGRPGAAVLARKSGGSRRDCDAIKKKWRAQRERERKACALRTRVAAPGIVRSFDQLYVVLDGVMRVLLVCADAHTPFRTTIALVPSYDSVNVARVIAHDLRTWGAPLVWRFDRASSHLTDTVQRLLHQWLVLPLCGPPRCPGYYGQMERMNREHREWLQLGPPLTSGNIGYEIDNMRTVLNCETIRPILNYRTAADVWGERAPPDIDRVPLRQEVYDNAVERYCERDGHNDAELTSWRFAVESALINRGLLTIEKGAWC